MQKLSGVSGVLSIWISRVVIHKEVSQQSQAENWERREVDGEMKGVEKALGFVSRRQKNQVMKLRGLLRALQRKGLVFSSPGTRSLPQTSDV